MNHRERLLDIANEAIAKLRAEGATIPWICKNAGLSPYAIRLWMMRESEPQLGTLRAVCMLAGFDISITVVPAFPTSRKTYPAPAKTKQWQFAQHAARLSEFSKRSLAASAKSTLGAARHWVRRNKHCLAIVRVNDDGTTVWRWVGEPVAQEQAAE